MMTSHVSSQGGKANKQGKILEDTIIPTFTARGFKLLNYKDWEKCQQIFGQELILKNAPYTTIYGHNGKSEFLVKSSRCNLNVRIECKWQQSAGSVDEKFPYLYLNCIESITEDIIIVIDGGGMKKGALAWLKDAVKHKKYMLPNQSKNIQVFCITEFLVWANTILK